MEINYLNLKRMFNHILLNVPDKKINMEVYRTGKTIKAKCGSTGCVIGHCTILDDYENIPKNQNGKINFFRWSLFFTGLEHNKNWLWCFGAGWPDNKTQILLRLKYFIDNQSTPEDWDCNWDCNWGYDHILPFEKLEPYNI